MISNPKANVLFAPMQGPLRNNNITREQEFESKKTILTGYVEPHNMDDFTFNEQYNTYQSFGYALDPSKGINNDCKNKSSFIGDKQSLKDNNAMTVYNQSNKMIKMKKKQRKQNRKRMKSGDPSDINGYLGPWAPALKTDEEKKLIELDMKKRREQWEAEHPQNEQKRKKRKLNDNNDSENEDDNEIKQETDEEKQQRKQERINEQIRIEDTTFHGDNMYDYQGRTYMFCSPEKRRKNSIEQTKYYLPKKCINTLIGHKKGVNEIKFIPRNGHLLLSCSNDNTVKIWDVYNDNKCLRTYVGHTKGVRNICFSKDGSRFLTTSYDKWIKCWDTETGKVIWRGTSGKMPYDATLYPDNENEFIVGQQNKVAVQWSMRSNKIIQTYSEHLMGVNTITFIDNNRRFITTSQDKKIFIWDVGIPVVIKHISEPSLHYISNVTKHVNNNWFLCQSMNNTIITYSTTNRFKKNIKKVFKGHLNAGYSCNIDVSYDGKYVMSGDANGKLYFWDWKTTKIIDIPIKAHNKVTMGCIWHPIMTSRVATCSWDCTIKLWD